MCLIHLVTLYCILQGLPWSFRGDAAFSPSLQVTHLMAVTSSTACPAVAGSHRGSAVPSAQGAAAGTLAGRSAKAQAL